MPTIRPSDLHPAEEVTFGLGGGPAFTLSPGGEYKTDDPQVADNAKVHPWLTVEDDPAPPQPTPDPAEQPNLVAINAGLDQNTSQTDEAGVFATTLAAADSKPVGTFDGFSAGKKLDAAPADGAEEDKD